MKAIICLSMVIVCASAASIKDIDIVESDMQGTTKDFAVGQALVLFTSETDNKVIAKQLVGAMNKRFGPGWFAQIGVDTKTTTFGINIAKNTTLLIRYKTNYIFIGQVDSHKEEITEDSWQKSIIAAKNAKVNILYTDNSTELVDLVKITKEVLTKENTKCIKEARQINKSIYCYKVLSDHLDLALAKEYFPNKGISVTVGSSNQCFTFVARGESGHLFALADIYFEIVDYDLP